MDPMLEDLALTRLADRLDDAISIRRGRRHVASARRLGRKAEAAARRAGAALARTL